HESGTAALVVWGAVDAGTAPRFDEMLRSRLCTELARLVLDLSGLEFLGLAGVSVLIEADLRARHTHTELLLRCGHNRQVTRVLTATAEHHQLRWHGEPTVSPSPAAPATAIREEQGW